MRTFSAAGVVFSALMISTAIAEEFPFSVFVIDDSTTIHSGPSRNFYGTDELVRGTELEVYKQNSSGWLAVRPPEGSFSWVLAKHLKPTDEEDIAEVTENDVAAYVGSSLSDALDLAQIRLKQGEPVMVLGSKRVESERGTVETWYKIAPPAGEFRWIHGDDVDREPPSAIEIAPREPAKLAELPPAQAAPIPLTPIAVNQVNDQQPAVEAAAAESIETTSWTSRNKTNGNQTTTRHTEKVASPTNQIKTKAEPLQRVAPVPKQTMTNERATTLPAPIGGVDAAYDELTAIDLELSRTVSGDPSTWQLARLRARATQSTKNGETPQQRSRARLLVEKISEFEDIQLRYNEMSVTRSTGAKRSVPSAEITPILQSDLEAAFDGSGWLMPVVSRRKDVPRYALTDNEGRILQFITPVPGLNLHRYLRKEIGVSGDKGVIPELDRPHLTAERIVVLDRHRR